MNSVTFATKRKDEKGIPLFTLLKNEDDGLKRGCLMFCSVCFPVFLSHSKDFVKNKKNENRVKKRE